MDSKKKDLEIVYNVQWKNKTANGGDKANIIGMYDIPATTLNWEIFKSYLLKNSGTTGDDVKVSYITSTGREFPIQSQTDFQIALYAFRRKARTNEIINLRLDRISDQSPPPNKHSRYSIDVETQFDTTEAASMASTEASPEVPPEWFVGYMAKFKKEILDEVETSVATVLSSIKQQLPSNPPCLSRKPKECSRRPRKYTLLSAETPTEKEILKSLKIERKLENKLEKLEHKTKKIKEKKLALFHKTSDTLAGQRRSHGHHGHGHGHKHQEREDELHMDAAPISTENSIPHMLGGEVYLHKWEVMNTGKSPWTSKTSLQFTWGSRALQALDTVVSCPHLKPGEKGTIAVRLQIPHVPGQYECYYHFHHKGRRFGHWLGCQVIVDPFQFNANTKDDEKLYSNVLKSGGSATAPHEVDSTIKKEEADNALKVSFKLDDSSEVKEQKSASDTKDTLSFNIGTNENYLAAAHTIDNILKMSCVDQISNGIGDLQLDEASATNCNCSSDSDNQSIVSLSDSQSSKSSQEEFVLVPVPDCFKVDKYPNELSYSQNVYGIDSCDLYVDWPKPGASSEALEIDGKTQNKEDAGKEEEVQQATEVVEENCDDNNNSGKNSSNESICKLDCADSASETSQKSDLVHISLPKEDEPNHTVMTENGQRVAPVATEAIDLTCTNPQNTNEPIDMSHCSAAGSSFSDVNSMRYNSQRLFVFPQGISGYEVVYPTIDVNECETIKIQDDENCQSARAPEPNLTTPHQPSQYDPYGPLEEPTPSAPMQYQNQTSDGGQPHNPFTLPSMQYVPNFQQTPPNLRQPVMEPQQRSEVYMNIPPEQQQNDYRGQQVYYHHPYPSADQPSNGGSRGGSAERSRNNSPQVHILPETLVSGAVNVASSAINTARSVISMIVPREPGRWVNGHWVSASAETPREANLRSLAEMGFWDRDLNATLLARYNDDLTRVVAELVQ